jgi:hypothetical protein
MLFCVFSSFFLQQLMHKKSDQDKKKVKYIYTVFVWNK